MAVERRDARELLTGEINLRKDELLPKAKPFAISKQMVLEAYRKVKSNDGVAGVDEESLKEFEINWKGNLYKLWNRLSSGSYFPPPVKAVEINKAGGGTRTLGIPTVADRIAQTVVKMVLEPLVEPVFDADSYGSRPKKSAHQALGAARERCWRQDWVIDLDIKGFFDNLDHDLILKAVTHHTKKPWILLYVKRWLAAPLQKRDGSLEKRTVGTPQGGVISPLLANLFMHYAFDAWMRREHPGIHFERYVDDAIVHASGLPEAEKLLESIRERLRECRLELHPVKTKIVYCRDGKRTSRHEQEKFDFLSYQFRTRLVATKQGKLFVSFNPAISPVAVHKIYAKVRSWRLKRQWTLASVEEVGQWLAPKVRGWLQYFGKFSPSSMRPVKRHLKQTIVRWAMRKYKRFRASQSRATQWVTRLAAKNSHFAWLQGV